MNFKLKKDFSPKGDQQIVIDNLTKNISNNDKHTIIGATGTGKTYVMAKIIEKINRPALIISHNKTLSAQLFKEFQQFFPDNAVEYFVSYYDYYQPEAYVAKKDLYIEKDASINAEIEKYRLKATASLMSRKDVIVVASVSCIYGLGSPEDYKNMHLHLKTGDIINRQDIIKKLIDIQYNRNDDVLSSGHFRVRGDVIDIVPSYLNDGIRIEMFGDEIEAIYHLDILNNKTQFKHEQVFIYPAKHFVMPNEKINSAIATIRLELDQRCKYFDSQKKLLENERLKNKTLYDLEMMENLGYCNGIENYSRHLSGRKEGEPPATLIDYFPKNLITFIDESHTTLPQIGGMFNGDRSRKQSLVDHGFRLPSALDNRPLYFEEFINKPGTKIFVSATPGEYELTNSLTSFELINRPTGLLDPPIEIRPSEGQIDDLITELNKTIENNDRILITTITKKMSEELTDHLLKNNFKVNYLHSDIETIERVEIITSLRRGEIDILVGINLLREGLDIPEVALIAILDADKAGFLRSKRSLIQTSGRAARNIRGRVIMYADKKTDAMNECIEETYRRRKIQLKFNKEHNITPKSISKPIDNILERESDNKKSFNPKNKLIFPKKKTERVKLINKLDLEMKIAADELDFELAIELRGQIELLKQSGKM